MKKVTSHFIKIFSLVVLVGILVIGGNVEKVFAVAGVSNKLSYQGRLTDANGNPYTGTYYVCFSIWDNPTVGSGAQLWPAGVPVSNTVTVTNGVFNASVGVSDTLGYDFSANDTVYLNVGVSASNVACNNGAMESLTPRQRLDAIPYARVAENLYGGEAQIGDPAGVTSGQKLLKLAVKSVADTVGNSGCTPNGALWYNSGNARTLVCNNNLYQAVGSSIVNQFFDVTGPTTAVKTFTFPDASATVLTSANAVTAIQGGTGQSTYATGDLLYASATNVLSKLAKGTADQVLAMDATGVNVVWKTLTGGGTPGGADTQIQFNDATAFGGDVDFVWNKTTNDLTLGGVDTGITLKGITLEPSTAPVAGTLHVYSKSIAGRMLPKWLGPSGVDTSFQASLGFNRIAVVNPAGGTTLATAVNAFATAFTNAGTVANPTPAATNALTSTRRVTFSSGTTAGTVAYHRQSTLMVWRGNNVNNAPGGFFYTIRFGTSVLAAGNRAFVGLADSVNAPTNVDPTTSTTPGKVGLAINANTGNWKFVHNVTGTAPAATDLGANFPVNTTAMYELVLYSKPNDTVINYRLTSYPAAGASMQVTGATLATNIPAATTFLAPLFWITNNATAAAAIIDFGGWYLESDQ